MSRKPKLLVSCRPTDAVLARVERDYDAAIKAAEINSDADKLVAASVGMDGIFARFTDPLNAETLGRLADSVGIIATYAVGYENIDVAAAAARGIVITNTPDVLTDATAEMTILLMLGAARCVHEGTTLLRSGQWKGPTPILGTQVTGKRLGIVGLGRIGKAVAQRARGFDMEIHYTDVERLPSEVEQGAVFHAEVEEMLPLCDVLSLHCPMLPETRKYLDAGRLGLLPRGAIVVNAARGAMVDDEALIAALRSGQVAAAGLDVYEGEPNLHPGYIDLANTFLMPHLGSATREARDAMGFKALANLEAFFAGDSPPDRVN
jgi:lactate dehydrogenase-like 2-hydroxyacid dehydrogenase